MQSVEEFYQRSICAPDEFWAEQAEAIYWEKDFESVCDLSRPPFAKWFVGGRTNLCYNAVDRHLEERGDQTAIYFLSTETDEERTLTYRELHREVNRMAAVLYQ
jgi:propionyl-CoA synthetase